MSSWEIYKSNLEEGGLHFARNILKCSYFMENVQVKFHCNVFVGPIDNAGGSYNRLGPLNRMYICSVSSQPICGDTCQI